MKNQNLFLKKVRALAVLSLVSLGACLCADARAEQPFQTALSGDLQTKIVQDCALREITMAAPQSVVLNDQSLFPTANALLNQPAIRQISEIGKRRSSNIGSSGLTRIGFILARDDSQSVLLRAGMSRLSSNASAGVEFVVNW